MIETPPFSVTPNMVTRISDISAQCARLEPKLLPEFQPFLRRDTHIQSVRASLAIEANSLSVDNVRSILNGQHVAGPKREIVEVRNALRAYDALASTDPYSLKDLPRIHGLFEEGLTPDAGSFRTHPEGVFQNGACIFMAPPQNLVPSLMDNLFAWINSVRGNLHPLVVSSVFHYELVFIHPFSDGNGRIARFWQNGLLLQWNSVFESVPIENEILRAQEAYYNAIGKSNASGNSTAFIEFMLERIHAALLAAENIAAEDDVPLSAPLRRLAQLMDNGREYTASQLQELLGLRSRDALRKTYLRPALDLNLIEMTDPTKPTSRNQKYRRRWPALSD